MECFPSHCSPPLSNGHPSRKKGSEMTNGVFSISLFTAFVERSPQLHLVPSASGPSPAAAQSTARSSSSPHAVAPPSGLSSHRPSVCAATPILSTLLSATSLRAAAAPCVRPIPSTPPHNAVCLASVRSTPASPPEIPLVPSTSPVATSSNPRFPCSPPVPPAAPSLAPVVAARPRCPVGFPILQAPDPPATTPTVCADSSSIPANCSSDMLPVAARASTAWPAPDSNARNHTPSSNNLSRSHPRSATCSAR